MVSLKKFLIGEIKEEYRGEYVAIIHESNNKSDHPYSTFLYRQSDEEVIDLTGTTLRTKSRLIRVYWGLSHKAGGEIVGRVNNSSFNEEDFRNLDSLVVTPYFLREE